LLQLDLAVVISKETFQYEKPHLYDKIYMPSVSVSSIDTCFQDSTETPHWSPDTPPGTAWIEEKTGVVPISLDNRPCSDLITEAHKTDGDIQSYYDEVFRENLESCTAENLTTIGKPFGLINPSAVGSKDQVSMTCENPKVQQRSSAEGRGFITPSLVEVKFTFGSESCPVNTNFIVVEIPPEFLTDTDAIPPLVDNKKKNRQNPPPKVAEKSKTRFSSRKESESENSPFFTPKSSIENECFRFRESRESSQHLPAGTIKIFI